MRLLSVILLFPLLSFAQDFNFVLETDSIPYEIDGWQPYCPWVGGKSKTCPEFCDIDSDGDFDLFIGHVDGRIDYFNNAGSESNPDFEFVTGNFAVIDLCGVDFHGNSSPVYCDIDGDNDFDLFSGDWDGYVHFWENMGTQFDPVFELVTDSLDNIDVTGYSRIDFADIDDDDDYDLFVGEGLGQILFYENTGTALNWDFELVTEEFANIDVGDFAHPCFVDIDADNDFDLFVGNYNGIIGFYRNDGDSVNYDYTLVTTFFDSIDIGDYASPELCDIDGDGDYDLLIGRTYDLPNNIQGNIFFYENTGAPESPEFEFITRNYISAALGHFSGPQLVDINGDNAVDIITRHYDKLVYIENNGDASNPSFVYMEEGFQNIDIQTLHPFFVDIDADGDYDLICGEGVIPTPSIALYINQGTPQEPQLRLFEENFIVNPYFWVNACPSCADIDADGDQDLFVTDDDGYVYYYRNDGTPLWPSYTYITDQWQGIYFEYPNDGWRYLSFADIDSDGDLDLFMKNYEHDNIRYYENIGTPLNAIMSLQEESILSGHDMQFANPDFADIDADGDFDMFCGDMSGGFWFFRNWGDSTGVADRGAASPYTFTLHPNYPNPFNAQTVIPFTLDFSGRVTLNIFDITGRSVGVQYIEPLQAGSHEVIWNAEGVASGVYLVRLSVDGNQQSAGTLLRETSKVILLK